MPVTLQDIADHLGFSRMTVSAALRGVGRCSPETRAKVQDAARQLGYRPNTAARATRTGRSGVIAMLTSADHEQAVLPNMLVDGMFDTLARFDLQLAITLITSRQMNDPSYVPKALSQAIADGILVNCCAEVPPRIVQLVDQYGLPAVWLGGKRPFDAVYTDEHAAARKAVELLLERGHRDIAYADYFHGTDEPANSSGIDRRAGYLSAMRDAGLTPRFLNQLEPLRVALDHQPTDFHGGRRLRYSIQWMQRDDCPTAIVAYGHETAIPIVIATGYANRRFPDGISLITFGDALWQTSISVDSMVNPASELGARAVEMLLCKLDYAGAQVPARVVPCWHRPGHTLGSPRRAAS